VADLLECLIQLKALDLSPARIRRFVAQVPPAARAEAEAVLRELVQAEGTYAAALARAGRPPETALDLASAGTGGDGAHLDAFAAARAATLVVLQGCSAEDLAAPVAWPGRPFTTTADLVAIMLARDTELAGALQRLAARD